MCFTSHASLLSYSCVKDTVPPPLSTACCQPCGMYISSPEHRHAYSYVYRHVYRQAYRHVYRYVHRHVSSHLRITMRVDMCRGMRRGLRRDECTETYVWACAICTGLPGFNMHSPSSIWGSRSRFTAFANCSGVVPNRRLSSTCAWTRV